MAEGLGTGLQNRLQQFESAWYLQSKAFNYLKAFLIPLIITIKPALTRSQLFVDYLPQIIFHVAVFQPFVINFHGAETHTHTRITSVVEQVLHRYFAS